MQFLIIGRDGDDEDALNRRMSARQKHLDLGAAMREAGNMWYGAAIVDEGGRMAGSAMFMDFESDAALQAWLDQEPYVVGNVWKSLDVIRCRTHEPWKYNRPKTFFTSRLSD